MWKNIKKLENLIVAFVKLAVFLTLVSAFLTSCWRL